jgi:hypothetical protein
MRRRAASDHIGVWYKPLTPKTRMRERPYVKAITEEVPERARETSIAVAGRAASAASACSMPRNMGLGLGAG